MLSATVEVDDKSVVVLPLKAIVSLSSDSAAVLDLRDFTFRIPLFHICPTLPLDKEPLP